MLDVPSFWTGFAAAILSQVALGGIVVAFLIEQKLFIRWRRHIHEVPLFLSGYSNCITCEDVVHVNR